MSKRRRAVFPRVFVFQRCNKHPLGGLEIVDADRGGCPEEGIPFETERAVFCRVCQQEVVSGTTECLKFLLREVQGVRVRTIEVIDDGDAGGRGAGGIDAEPMGKKKARISEQPLGGDLNIDDVVALEKRPPMGYLYVVEVVQRRFGLKSVVEFQREEDFATLKQFFESRGWSFRISLMPGPTGKPGLAVLAHRINDEKPQAVIKSAGLKRVKVKTRRVGPEGKIG